MVIIHPIELLGQTTISGIVNTTSSKVNSVAANYVTVDDRTGFTVGDFVLLIQMKGALIRLEDESGYGLMDDIGSVGRYEFLVVSSVVPGAGTLGDVYFTTPGISAYDTDGSVQLIKVPFYESAVVGPAGLTCMPWDSASGTGGVLAVIIGGKLELSGDINVSGKGFIGGAVTTGSDECVSLDVAVRDKFSYDITSIYSGFKGEGIASKGTTGPVFDLFPGYTKGKGSNATGGGGGNGRYAGGGGGSNYGAGGNGTSEANPCAVSQASGRGGRAIIAPDDTILVMRGGGGSSTYALGSTASPGGRGGGIVIIMAEAIEGNTHNIKADGEDVTPATISGNAGAGGGGAGGSVALYASSYGTTPLNLTAKGGKGGNTLLQANGGRGGGGGGGLIWARSASANVLKDMTGGLGGGGAAPGADGKYKDDFKIRLNGFLFNFVRSTITLSSIDSICEGTKPPPLSGTVPAGGKAPFSYSWEKSYDHLNPLSWVSVSTADFLFTPVDNEVDTVWFRRVITDSSVPVIVDYGNIIKIAVQPLIQVNTIANDTTICFNQNPEPLKQFNPGPTGGNGIYTYLWKKSSDNIDFSVDADGPGTITDSSYDPPQLTADTYFRRITTSGRCVDNSNSLKITVLPSIPAASNTITADQTICQGDLFADLTGSTPTGGAGAGTYSYTWLSKTSSTAWVPAAGVNNLIGYNPDEAEFPETRFFRRLVVSGPADVCRDTSSARTLIMHPAIAGNTITGDQTICSGSQPLVISGDVPTGGDGTYTYTWQDSSKLHTWTNIPGFINSASVSYLPPVLTDSTSYRRIANSSACTGISNVVRIYVHKPLANFGATIISGGTDTTVCFNSTPNTIVGGATTGGTGIPGDYAYSWFYSEDNSTWQPVPAAGTGKDYQPGALAITTWFKRRVVSGECIAESGTVRIIVLPLIANNTLPADRMVCYGTIPAIITGSIPTGGDGSYTYLWEQSTDGGGTWNNAGGTNNLKDYQPAALTAPVMYRRIVFSGLANCCSDVTAVPISMGINPLPTGTITSVKDTVCQGGSVIMNISIGVSVASPWSIQYFNGSGNVTIPSVATASYDISLTPSSTATYTLVSVTDANNCAATSLTGSFEVVVYQNPDSRTTPDTNDEICGLTYVLTPIPSVGTGVWLWPGVPVTGNTDQGSGKREVVLSAYGTYSFWWKETNWKCKDSARIDVKFWEMPVPVEAGGDNSVVLNFVKLDATPPTLSTSMRWSYPGDPASIVYDDETDPLTWVSGLSFGQNVFTWTVENGMCLAEDQVTITYNPVPNGFSPDGNGINDLFEIPGLEGTENELVITSGTGAEIIRFKNYSSESGYWDGMDRNGKYLPDGTYYYFLTITSRQGSSLQGQPSRLNGFLVIKRLDHD